MEIRLGLSKKTAAKKREMAEEIELRMAGNDHFPDADNLISNLNTARTSLRSAELTVDGLVSDLTRERIERNRLELELDDALRHSANFAELVTEGNREKLISGGFELRRYNSMGGTLPPKVTGVTVREGDQPGLIVLDWEAVRNRSVYVLQANVDPDGSGKWVQVALPSKSQYLFDATRQTELTRGDEGDGLRRGDIVYFRVAAKNPSGMGPWSETVIKVVP